MFLGLAYKHVLYNSLSLLWAMCSSSGVQPQRMPSLVSFDDEASFPTIGVASRIAGFQMVYTPEVRMTDTVGPLHEHMCKSGWQILWGLSMNTCVSLDGRYCGVSL